MKFQNRPVFAASALAAAFGMIFVLPPMMSLAHEQDPQAQDTKHAVKIRILVVESTSGQVHKHPQADALIKAGGKIISEPTLLTLEGMNATVEIAQSVPYSIAGTNQTPPPSVPTVRIGLKISAVPHIEADRKVRVDLEADDTELAPSGAPATVKHGISNSLALTAGNSVLFGVWTEGKRAVAVFVSAEEAKPGK
jgi:hypothetical protein